MSRTYHHGKKNKQREVRIRAIKRDRPDFRKLGRALISLAEAELEAEAQQQVQHPAKAKKKRGTS